MTAFINYFSPLGMLEVYEKDTVSEVTNVDYLEIKNNGVWYFFGLAVARRILINY